MVVGGGGGDNGSCCSYGDTSGWFFFFFFQWWWPATASCGCGFAKKVVGFQRKGETQIRRERRKRERNIHRIKNNI